MTGDVNHRDAHYGVNWQCTLFNRPRDRWGKVATDNQSHTSCIMCYVISRQRELTCSEAQVKYITTRTPRRLSIASSIASAKHSGDNNHNWKFILLVNEGYHRGDAISRFSKQYRKRISNFARNSLSCEMFFISTVV